MPQAMLSLSQKVVSPSDVTTVAHSAIVSRLLFFGELWLGSGDVPHDEFGPPPY